MPRNRRKDDERQLIIDAGQKWWEYFHSSRQHFRQQFRQHSLQRVRLLLLDWQRKWRARAQITPRARNKPNRKSWRGLYIGKSSWENVTDGCTCEEMEHLEVENTPVQIDRQRNLNVYRLDFDGAPTAIHTKVQSLLSKVVCPEIGYLHGREKCTEKQSVSGRVNSSNRRTLLKYRFSSL